MFSSVLGSKSYELKDHLGNVRAVITDQKLLEDIDGNDEINLGDYYTANVVSFSDYFPFGMLQRSGQSTDNNYRFGFQGQESDDEVKGKGNSVNYKYRMHDPRLGRFFATDPLEAKYPHNSPYAFSENVVIHMVELEGLEKAIPSIYQLNSGDTYWGIASKLDNVSAEDLIKWNPTKHKNKLHKFTGTYIYLSNPEESSEFTVGDIPGGTVNDDFTMPEFGKTKEELTNDVRVQNMGEFAHSFAWFFAGMTASSVAPPGRPTNTPKSFDPIFNSRGITLKNSAPQYGPNYKSYNVNIENGNVNIVGRAKTHGSYDFVVTNDGKLHLGNGHYNLSGGAPTVRAAGQMKIYNGQVKSISNNSGHYKPSISEGSTFGKTLKDIGVDAGGAKLRLYNSDGILESTTIIKQ